MHQKGEPAGTCDVRVPQIPDRFVQERPIPESPRHDLSDVGDLIFLVHSTCDLHPVIVPHGKVALKHGLTPAESARKRPTETVGLI